MVKCGFCKKDFPRIDIQTLLSFSEAGGIVYTLICGNCIKNHSLKAIRTHDKMLDSLDKDYRFYDLS